MKNISITTHIQVLDNINQLDIEEAKALSKAIDMLDAAYAPYSDFQVGAAAVTNTGNIYGGCNQENASYPLCICGERVALYNAGANEATTPIKILAIVAHNRHKTIEKPVSPCGACRQVIAEFEARHRQKIIILLKSDTDTIYRLDSGSSLLPMDFDGTYL